jgi:ABC-type glycerol-3-phosphate transport system substrate-binding protein
MKTQATRATRATQSVQATQRRREVVIRLAALGACSSALGAACGVGGDSAGSQEGAALTRGPVEIELWKSFAETHRFSLIDDAVVEGYRATSPDKTVRVGAVNTGWAEKLKTAVAGGTPPNIVLALQSGPVEYMAIGAAVDMEAELKGNRQWGRIKGETIPVALDIMRWKGRLGGLPLFVTYEGLGFNTELLKQAGLAMPRKDWTWEDYLELGRRVAKPDEIWLGMQQFLRFNYWHESNLGYNANREQTRITVDTPQNIEALEFKVAQVRTRRLETDAAAPAGAPPGTQYTWFGQGKQLTQIVNPGALTPPRYPGIPIEVINHPHGPSNKRKEVSLSGAAYGYMVLRSPDPARQRVAAEMALHALTPEQQIRNAQVSGEAPANQAALKSQAFMDSYKDNRFLAEFYALASHIYPLPSFPGWSDALLLQGENMGKALKGEMTPRDALREVQPRMQALLDRALG